MKKNAALIFALIFAVFCSGQKSATRVPGVVNGDNIAIKALAAGTLKRIEVKEGDQVRKGQLIAEMDLDKLQNTLDELRLSEQEIGNGEERARQKMEYLKANITYLQKQVQRFSRLKENESVSGDQLERAQLQLLEAQTALSDLEKSLAAFRIQREKIANKRENLRLLEKDLVFLSPVDGVVLNVYTTAVGETALPGTILAEVLDLSSLYVEVFIEEQEMAALKLGQDVTIIPDGEGGRSFQGQISYFGKKAEFSPKYILSEKERQSLLYQLKIKVLAGQQELKLGMPVTVSIKK